MIDTTNKIFRISCGAEFALKLIGRKNCACVSCACLSTGSTWSSATQNDHRMTSKYRESNKKAVGSYAFESLLRYFDVIRWSFCSALLQVECTLWEKATPYFGAPTPFWSSRPHLELSRLQLYPSRLKYPYYELWKAHILVLWVPNNRLTCMQGKKIHFHCLIICFYFYLICLTTPKTIPLTINFSKPLLCVTLWLVQKRHLVAMNEFTFSFRPMRKDQQVGGQCANVSCWHQHETSWYSFKKRLVLMIQSRLFLLRDNNFTHGATFRFKTLQDVFIHLELCYTLHERSFSKIHNRGTLNRLVLTMV